MLESDGAAVLDSTPPSFETPTTPHTISHKSSLLQCPSTSLDSYPALPHASGAFTLSIAALAENLALAADESTVNGKVSSSA